MLTSFATRITTCLAIARRGALGAALVGSCLALASAPASADQPPGSSTLPACRTSTVTLSVPGEAFTCNTWCRIAAGDKRPLATFAYTVNGGPNSANACMQRCAGTPGCTAVSWKIEYFAAMRPDGTRGTLTCEVWGDAVTRVDQSPMAGGRFEPNYACLRNWSPSTDPVFRIDTDKFNQDQFRPGQQPPTPPPPPPINNSIFR